MSRMLGTVSMGVRAPIIRQGDDLAQVVTDCILSAVKEDGLVPRDRDIVAMTEAIVARAQGNYVTVDDIAEDIRRKFSKYAADDGIAFVDAYIAENPAYWVYYEMVNNGKREVAERSPLNVVVDTSMLVCTGEPVENPDVPHYDSLSEIKLGHMFAEQLAAFMAE